MDISLNFLLTIYCPVLFETFLKNLYYPLIIFFMSLCTFLLKKYYLIIVDIQHTILY